jgi:hypothetical protein
VEGQYYNKSQNYLNNYNMNGQKAYNTLQGQQMALNDPAALENSWASGYQESPFAKQLQAQAQSSGMDAASSMGLQGSSPAINNVQTSSGNIMQADRQQYLNDLMQKYMASVGIGQNLYGTGAAAAGQLSSNAMTEGQNQAGLAYGAQNAPGSAFGSILGMLLGAKGGGGSDASQAGQFAGGAAAGAAAA